MRKLLPLLLFSISFPVHAQDMKMMYGLAGLPEPDTREPDSKSYVQIMGSSGSLQESDVKNSSGTSLGKAKFASGYGSSFTIGSKMMDPIMIEIELDYGDNKINSAPAGTLSGNLKSYAAMANLGLDVDLGLPVVKPYVSGGAGYARISDSKNAADTFAYQFGGGLGFEVSHNVELVTEYKYFRANDVKFGSGVSQSKFDYVDQGIEAGIKLGL